MEAAIGFSPEGRFKKRLTDKIHNDLPCYEIYDGEITGISFVTNPANERKAVIVSEEEKTIAGVFLIPQKEIYRIDPLTGEEYYIFFTKEVIQLLFEKYRLVNWSQTEKEELIRMYSQGYSIAEIGTHLKRPEENVINFIEKAGDNFRNLVIITMYQNKYSAETIANRINVSIEELTEIVRSFGGNIVSSGEKK